MAKGGNTVKTVWELAQPIAEELGLRLWDVRFLKEGSQWYLRIFIDKDGGVSIDDCVDMTHAVNGPLDEADPVEQAYILEVSSPGLERELKTPDHIKAFIGERVIVKLYAAKDGKKSFDGNIVAYNDDDASLTLEVNGSEIVFGAKEYSSIKTVCEF